MGEVELFVEWAGLPREAARMLADWEMVPLHRASQLIGLAAVSGTEIHFALEPSSRHRGIQRTRAREFLAPLIARRGYLTTSSMHGDDQSRRFVERMGFRSTWTDNQFDHYMLTALPFGSEN